MKRIISNLMWIVLILSFPTVVSAVTVNFDEMSSGDPVNTVQGVIFASNTGLQLTVYSEDKTTSGLNSLGVWDGQPEPFLSSFGDEIYLSFLQPVISLSANFIGVPVEFPPLYIISTSKGESASSSIITGTLDDGGEVVHVSLMASIPFKGATLKGSGDLLSYNIDDIEIIYAEPVPEPATGLLVVLGLAMISGMNKRKLI